MEEEADPRLIATGAAVIDVGQRDVIRATGADRVSFLHRLLTGDVSGLAPCAGGRSLLLDVKGRIVGDLLVFLLADEVRLVVAAGEGRATAAALSQYAVMDDFAATVDVSLRLLAVHGPATDQRLRAAGVGLSAGFEDRPPWSHEEVAIEGAGRAWLLRSRACGAGGVWVFASAEAIAVVEDRLSRAGVRHLQEEVAEALRIASFEPRFGFEITSECFPMEVGLSHAIDYRKGCFLGQEPIVRIRDRGHINWRLVGLRVRGEIVPARGDPLEADMQPRAGRVTSAARLPGEAPAALAMLHVSVPDGAEVRIRHGDALLTADVAAVGAG